MLLSIHHETILRYSAPITESAMQVRLTIPSTEYQLCQAQEIVVQPYTRLASYKDGANTTVHFFTIVPPHQQVTVISRAVVRTQPRNPFALDPDPTSTLDAGEAFVYRAFDGPIEYMPAVLAMADRCELRDPTLSSDALFERVQRLNSYIHEEFEYDPSATAVHSPISEVLSHHRGVCQDFAHLMIAVCRSAGLAARYVSGYIYSRPDDGTRGAGASHAWCDVYFPQVGWRGFDPTNCLLYGETHVVIAVGRDYRDVPPTRGVYRGNATEEISVAVETIQLTDAHGHTF